MTKEHALQLLWRGFKYHLRESWDTYESYGSGLDEANKQIRFSEAVIKQMESDFSEKGIDFEPLNHLTLYNYFKTDGFSTNAKKKTLNTFSAFIGHKNWDTFQKEVLAGIISENSFPEADQPSPDFITPGPAGRKKGRYRLLLFTLAVTALISSILVWNHLEEQRDEMIKIEKAIKAASAAEFNAYTRLPKIDSNNLKNYYIQSGTAYNTILSVLLRSQKRNRKLMVPPSSYVIDDIEITELEEDQAEAETSEHWIIRWYDGESDSEMLFDTINRHIYYLLKENGRWKVQVDAYSGKSGQPGSTFARKK